MYRFDEETKEMTLQSLHPGVDVEVINERSGFEIQIPDDYGHNPQPTDEELRILREEIDPRGIIR